MFCFLDQYVLLVINYKGLIRNQMRVCNQLSSPTREYFKLFTIYEPSTILHYLNYLTTPKDISHDSPNTLPLPQDQSNINLSKDNMQLRVLVDQCTRNREQFRNTRKGEQFRSCINKRRDGDEVIEVRSEDGNIYQLPMRNIRPIANLSLLLQANSFHPESHLQIDQTLLGNFKEQILAKCLYIPITYLVTPPNILGIIKTQQSCKGQKIFTTQQTRSLMSSINHKLYLQLVKEDINLKQLNLQTIKNPYYQKELKTLDQYYEQKIQQLFNKKELTVVAMYVLSGEFFISENYFQQPLSTNKYFPLCSKKYVYSFFNFIERRKHKFWPYQSLSLQSIVTLIDLFFDKTQYKLSFYFDSINHSVQKIEIKPFVRFSDHLLGKGFTQMLMKTETRPEIINFPLKANIFDILINSSPDMKTYYKIPQAKSNSCPKMRLQDLIETMSQIGFKMSEISSILRNFSLIMNILLLQVQEKQRRMNQFSTFQMGLTRNIGYKNIHSLYSQQLKLIQSILLNEQINNIQLSKQLNEGRSTGVKRQILASILWQFAITRMANEINSKIQNVGRDLFKTKRFDIYCHCNSSNTEPDSGKFIEEMTLQQSEYQIVGRKLVEKQFPIQKNNQHQLQFSKNKKKLSEKNHNIDSLSFRNQIHSSYLLSLEKGFTSFNTQLINIRRMSYCLYNTMKSVQEIKRIGLQVFHLGEISETCEKYWREFFENCGLQEEGKYVQSNYLICGDYYHFINQQKEGKQLLRFLGKMIQDQIVHKIRINKQLQAHKSSQNSDESLLDQHKSNIISNLRSTNNPISNTNHALGNTTNQASQKPQIKRNLFIQKENLSPSELEGGSLSIIKTPHRSSFSIELPDLVTKYLYGEEFKEMHTILISMSKQFADKVNPYDCSKIYQILQSIIIQISYLTGASLPVKKQQKILRNSLDNNQISNLLLLPFFQLNYDHQKQSYYIEATQSLFFKIQRQGCLQKQAIHKIITLFRAHKMRKNHQVFIFRKKFLKNIHKICNLTQLVKNTLSIIQNLQFTLLRNAYAQLKWKWKVGKLIKYAERIYNKQKENLLIQSFEKLTYLSKMESEFKKINLPQQQKKLQQLDQSIKQLKPIQYSLTVTSPSGKIKNLDDQNHKSNDELLIGTESKNRSNLGKLQQKRDNKVTGGKVNLIQEEKEPIVKKSDLNAFIKKQKVQTVDIFKRQLSQQASNTKDQRVDQLKTQPKPQQYNNPHVSRQSQLIQPIKLTQDPIKKPKILNEPLLQQEIHKEMPKISQVKSQINGLQKSKVSELSNEIVSVGMSGSLVSCRSQHSQKLTKTQLFTLKDSPFFSFESWSKQTRTVHLEVRAIKPNPVLFRKLEAEKIKPHQQSQREVSEDMTLKQKIVNGSFVGYLKQNLNRRQEQNAEQICFYQKKLIQKPLLKDYSIQKHGSFYKDSFNHILKLSLFKNTSKKLFELLNLLIKPIRYAYRQQKSAQQTLFEDEPLMINSYDSVYNLYRDQMFLQFTKQIMGNKDEDSLTSISFVLEIITKNYHPSPKFFYPFLSFIKTNELAKPQLYGRIYENLIKFAQAIEGYKGLNLRLYKEQLYMLSENEYNEYLQPRESQFTVEECKGMGNKIQVGLFNGQKYEFIVRNQTLRSIKKRMVFQLGFGQYENNFGLYQQKGQKNYFMMIEKQKGIDYLARTAPSQPKLVLRVRQYYPIKFTDLNSLRMFYLNQISQQCHLPFKTQDYEHIVALGISFDQFQQTRIGNFMLLKKQKLKDQDLKGIKSKLEQYAQVEGDHRICEFEYFKKMKEFNMLLAKSYRVSKEKEKYFEEIDKLIVKPKELCFYASTIMKSSISLYRIKSFYFQNEEIHIELIYSDRDLGDGHDKKFHGVVKSLTLKGFRKIAELYEDIVYYTELLQLGKTK